MEKLHVEICGGGAGLLQRGVSCACLQKVRGSSTFFCVDRQKLVNWFGGQS